MAVLEGHRQSGEFYDPATEVKAVVYDFTELNWTHRGAMLVIQGEVISTILGPALFLLRVTHRVIGHPRPGMDDVRVLVPLQNPQGLQSMELMKLALKRGF